MVDTKGMNTYTLIPTDFDSDLSNMDDLAWVTNDDDCDHDLEGRVIAVCREAGYSGAHVLTGVVGALYDDDGYETNYCGWIDAR